MQTTKADTVLVTSRHFITAKLIQRLMLAVFALVLTGCGGGGGAGGGGAAVNDATTPELAQSAQLSEVGVRALTLTGGDSDKITVFSGGARTVGLNIELVDGTADADLTFQIRSGGAFAGFVANTGTGSRKVATSVASVGPGTYPFSVAVTNKQSAKTAVVVFNVEVTAGLVVASSAISSTATSTSIHTSGGQTFVVNRSGPGADVDLQIVQTTTGDGTVLTRFLFSQDVSSTGLTISLPNVLPVVQVNAIALFAKATANFAKIMNASNAADVTPYAADSNSLGNLWKNNPAWFLEDGGYRVPTGVPLLIKNSASSKSLIAGGGYYFDVTQYAAASRLTSIVPFEKDLLSVVEEPVLFIHGFTASLHTAKLGGGKATFSYFPALVSQGVPTETRVRKFIPFEFQWSTNARFNDVAIDLAQAINLIHQRTGKKVHVVAHSFGGVLTRSVLQKITNNYYSEAEADVSAARLAVASLVTLGTPHSGIFDNDNSKFVGYAQAFPNGQDSGFFEGCGAITCHQMGEPVVGVPTSLVKINDAPGEIVAKLHETISLLPPIPIVVGIGMNRYDGLGDNSKYHNGDGLISYWGQRFSPADTTGELRQGVVLPAGGSTVYENILGVNYDALPGWTVRAGDLGSRPYGYMHSTDTGFSNVSLIGEADGQHRDLLAVGVEASPRLNCEGLAGKCDHAGYLLFRNLMRERYCAILKGGICFDSVIDGAGNQIARSGSTSEGKLKLSGTLERGGSARTVEIYDGETRLGRAILSLSAVDFSHSWVFELSSALVPGNHVLTARVTWSGTDVQATSEKWNISVTSSSTAPGLLSPANGNRYEIITCGTWPQCDVAAKAKGGNLATIRSKEENDWILSTFRGQANSSNGFWIGMRLQNSLWGWASGDVSAFRNWNPGEPNEPAGDIYTHMYTTSYSTAVAGLWNNSAGATVTQAVIEYLGTQACVAPMVLQGSVCVLPAATIVVPVASFLPSSVSIAVKVTSACDGGLVLNSAAVDGPNSGEWTVPVATAGNYRIEVEYAAALSRPVEALVDGVLVNANALADTSGSWCATPSIARAIGTVNLAVGEHKLRLQRGSVFPHLKEIRFVPTGTGS